PGSTSGAGPAGGAGGPLAPGDAEGDGTVGDGAFGSSSEPRPVSPALSENGSSARIFANSAFAADVTGATFPAYTPGCAVTPGHPSHTTRSRGMVLSTRAILTLVVPLLSLSLPVTW